jgi:hypothetical protein
MRKILLAAAVAGAFTAPAAQAQFSANIGAVTDYRFRGISQTNKKPALQGGLDYGFSNGLYVGTWASMVTKDLYPHGKGLEVDLYGGWKKEIAKDLTLDVGALYYWYPSSAYYTYGVGGTANTAKSGNKFNNTELYIGASYKWFSAKYSYATSNYFGASSAAFGNATLGGVNSNNTATGSVTGTNPGNSKGSSYLDLSANYEFAPKWTLNAHIGVLRVKTFTGLSYDDYKLGVTYDAGWASLSAAFVGTTAQSQYYRVPSPAAVTAGVGSTVDPTRPTLVLGILKTF